MVPNTEGELTGKVFESFFSHTKQSYISRKHGAAMPCVYFMLLYYATKVSTKQVGIYKGSLKS
jgi:hypothetical protein